MSLCYSYTAGEYTQHRLRHTLGVLSGINSQFLKAHVHHVFVWCVRCTSSWDAYMLYMYLHCARAPPSNIHVDELIMQLAMNMQLL